MEASKKIIPLVIVAIIFAVGGYFVGKQSFNNSQEASVYNLTSRTSTQSLANTGGVGLAPGVTIRVDYGDNGDDCFVVTTYKYVILGWNVSWQKSEKGKIRRDGYGTVIGCDVLIAVPEGTKPIQQNGVTTYQFPQAEAINVIATPIQTMINTTSTQNMLNR